MIDSIHLTKQRKMIVLTIFYLFFLIITLPFRIAIDRTKKYTTAITLRNIIDICLGVFIVLSCMYLTIQNIIGLAGFSGWIKILGLGYTVLLVVPYVYFTKWFFGYSFLYPSSHINNLDFFILYLRSFKDDKKMSRKEYKLMKCLDKLFCTFEIGRPNEFYPSTGACRIYVGETWKKDVISLMSKAPIILMRVNTTDNYLWEFEQCYLNKYLFKTILWITNLDEYRKFSIHILQKYGISLPNVDVINTVIYPTEIGFKVQNLKKKKSYKGFIEQYLVDKKDLDDSWAYYFHAKNNKVKLFFSLKKDKELMKGVQRWNVIAFLLPEFFVICNRIKYRIPIYLGLCILNVFAAMGFILLITLFYGIVFENNLLNVVFDNVLLQTIIIFTLFINLYVRLLWGRNGTTIVWLSENWESFEYFEEILDKNNYKANLYCLIFILIIGLYILLL